MSWLKPDKIPYSGDGAQKRVDRLVEEHGVLGSAVLEAFNEVDPLHCFFGENVDEYAGYVERFFKKLGGRDFKTLTGSEVEELVKGSFHDEQIAKGFVDKDAIEALIHGIIAVWHPHP